MSECFSEFYVCNGIVKPSAEFSFPNYENVCVYEVLRVIDGVPLFSELHAERFFNSLNIKNINAEKLLLNFNYDIQLLIQSNSIKNGNIRYECFTGDKSIDRFAYYIAHSYPDEKAYKTGVSILSTVVLRPDPNAKIVHKAIKDKIDKILENKYIYEVALTDDLGFISEGSRSNLFFIKGNEIYTAADNIVLLGVTRKKVIEVITRIDYNINYEGVNVKELRNYDAAFLTGTSPKVLGINRLNEISFDMNNEILKEIYLAYNHEIESYIKNRTL